MKYGESSYITSTVKHGLVSRVHDWPYSTFHRDVARGLYPRDWAGSMDAPTLDAGEPDEPFPANSQ